MKDGKCQMTDPDTGTSRGVDPAGWDGSDDTEQWDGIE